MLIIGASAFGLLCIGLIFAWARNARPASTDYPSENGDGEDR